MSNSPQITKEQFMEYWRSDSMSEELSLDERMEIFFSAAVGTSDITKDNLDALCGYYGVEDIEVVRGDVSYIGANYYCLSDFCTEDRELLVKKADLLSQDDLEHRIVLYSSSIKSIIDDFEENEEDLNKISEVLFNILKREYNSNIDFYIFD